MKKAPSPAPPPRENFGDRMGRESMGGGFVLAGSVSPYCNKKPGNGYKQKAVVPLGCSDNLSS